MHKLSALLLFVALHLTGHTQSYFIGSGIEHYNKHLINPSFIASDTLINVDYIYYKFYANVESSPSEQLATANIPLQKINSGIMLEYKQKIFGNIITNTASAGYAYNYHIKDFVLKIGIQCAIQKQKLKGSWIYPDGSDGSTDPAITPLDNSEYFFENNYGIGIDYHGFNAGYSFLMHQLSEENLFTNESLHCVFAGYYFSANSWLKFTPIINTYIGEKTEINLITTLYENFRLGASYAFGKPQESSFISKDCFKFSAGATIYKHAYINLVLNTYDKMFESDSYGYNILAQVGCRF